MMESTLNLILFLVYFQGNKVIKKDIIVASDTSDIVDYLISEHHGPIDILLNQLEGLLLN